MATKINPGLVALSADTTDVSTPFTPTDPKLLSLAAEQSNKDPKKVNVLSGMMQRMEDLQNPWKRFQGQMDEIVARTHFRPEAAMASVNEQQGRNTTELQNIGTTLAQLKFLQNQQASINNLFKPTGSGGAESTGVSGGFGGAGIGGTGGTGGPMLNGNIPLTNLENLNLNLIKHDPSLFFPALDKMTNNYSKENAKWQGPEAYDSQAVPITVRGPDGVVDTISVELTKAEIRDLKQGIFPSRLRNSGLTPATIKQKQKNASGGVVLQNHLAGGGQPMQPMGAEVEVGPLYTDAGVEIPKMAPAVRQPGMLENALTALSGSGEAQAGDWRTQFDPKLSQSQQEAKQSSELSEQKSNEAMAQEKNKAELESEKEERKEAGMFVGKIGSLSSTFDDIQRRSNAIINHASKHPEEFAYRQQSGPYSYLLSGVKAAPFINGAELANSLEAFKEKASGQDTINRRKETQGNADSLGIEYTQEKFAGTGARIGQGLTKIAQDAKNIGIDKPANTNLINAYMIQATAGKYKDWAQAWQDYKKANPKNPNPFTFQTSPEFKAVENKWSTYLDQKLGALEKGMPKDGTEDVDKNGNPIIWKNGKPMRVKQ